MQKNKILAVYLDLCDHGYISDAFMDSANEVVCVTCIIEAVWKVDSRIWAELL